MNENTDPKQLAIDRGEAPKDRLSRTRMGIRHFHEPALCDPRAAAHGDEPPRGEVS